MGLLVYNVLIGLGWFGLGWAGLGSAWLGWAGLGWSGLGWAGVSLFLDTVWALNDFCSRLCAGICKCVALELFFDLFVNFGTKNQGILSPGDFSAISGRYRPAGLLPTSELDGREIGSGGHVSQARTGCFRCGGRV